MSEPTDTQQAEKTQQTEQATTEPVQSLEQLQQDFEALRANRDKILGEKKKLAETHKTLEGKLAQIEAEKQQANEEAAKQSGDVASLEKSYQDKLAKAETEAKATIAGLQQQIYELTVGQAANTLANELAIKGSAVALLPHIQNRLTLKEGEDGTQTVRVLDLQGNISALTLDDLKQEFRGNDAFKPIIAGNNASGSGATGAIGSAIPPKKPTSLADCKTMDDKKAWLANRHS